jgi:putative transposase
VPRAQRPIYEGAVYHVYQRGNNKDYIFKDANSKVFLLKEIKAYNKIFDFQLLAFVIMDNHFHLLIKANKIPISTIMFNLDNVLSKFLVRVLDRTGHVFQGRYGCELVDSDAYLLWCLRYIHRNPVRAKICSKVDQYRWSSHYFYKNGINGLVYSDFILNTLSNNKLTAINQYLELINYSCDEEDKNKEYEIFKKQFSLPDNGNFFNIELSSSNKSQVPMEELLNQAGISNSLYELLKIGSRSCLNGQYKYNFIAMALKEKYTLKQIGEFLNISESAVCKFITRYNQKNN